MYGSLEKIVEETKKTGLPFWKVIQKEDCHEEDLSEEQAFLKMMTMYEQMKESAIINEKHMYSASCLVGGEAKKLRIRMDEG